MKKSILKTMIQFNYVFDLNVKIKLGKLKVLPIDENDINFIKINMLKNEGITSQNEFGVTVDTDLNSTIIKKYEGFYIISEYINRHTCIGRAITNYYKFNL